MKTRRRRRAVPAFSVVTILRNEAARLPRLLASIAEFRSRGGEVVVLDTGSDDGTPRMAKEAGCRVVVAPRRFSGRLTERQAERVHRVFSRRGEGAFLFAGERTFDEAAARNHAASMARNDFQLAVDGSDLVEAMDLDFLDQAVRAGNSQLLRFETRRLHENRWFLETRDYFHDRRAFSFAGRAHNFVTPARSGTAPKATLLPRACLRIAHHTDSAKPRGHQLAGVLLDALRWPRSPSRGFLVGRELAIRGHYQSALAAFLAQDRPEAPPPLRSAALCMAAACLAETVGAGSQDAVAALLFKAARRDPGRRDPWIQLARQCIAAGDFQAAVSFATAALAIPPQLSFAELEENLRDGPHAILYWALFWLGKRREAAKHLEICLDLEPLNPVYREHARLVRPGLSG